MADKKAKLVIQAYSELMLSNQWLAELFWPACGTSRWCHVTKHNRVQHTVRWAPRDPWEQVTHVDPVVATPTVNEFARREARRHSQRRADSKRVFDAG